MPMPLSVAAAAAQRAGMSPDAVNGIRKLLMEQAAAQGAPEQPEQPSQPAQPEVPGQSASWLAAPATASSSPAPGWSIPREAPPQAAAPQAPEAPRFDLAKSRGMAIYEDAMTRARESSWLAPHSIRRQAEDEARTGLELARMEMAAANAQDESSQRKLDREESRLHRDASEAQQRSQWWAAENTREKKTRQTDLEEAEKRRQEWVRLGLTSREIDLREKDLGERAADRRDARDQRREEAALRWAGKYGYDPTAENPAATGVFRTFAREAFKTNPDVTPEEVSALQVRASQAGALPPMMSRPSDRPRIAKQKGTGRRFYVFPDGRMEPAE